MNVENDGKQTAKTALFNTLINFSTFAVGMITIPIITRIMPTYDVGLANTFFSTRNTMAIFVSLATYSYVNKAMLDFKNEKKEFLFSLVVFCMCFTALLFGIASFFKEEIMQLLSLNNFLFKWLFVSALFYGLYHVAYYYCAFHNKIVKLSSIMLINGAIAPILSILLVSFHEDSKYKWRVLGLDFSLILVSSVLIIWLNFFGKKKIKKIYFKKMLSFSLPMIPYLLSQMILTQCDLIMISYFIGENASGIYSMGHVVGFLAFSATVQVLVVWSPWVYRRLEDGEKENIFKYSKYIVLIAAYFSVGLITISSDAVNIFLPKDYKDCIYIVPILVVAMFFQAIYVLFYDVMYYYKKTGWIAGISVIAAITNIILNYLLIPRYGYMAAGFTTLFSYILMLFLGYVFTVKLGINRIYNIKFIAGICIVVLVYMGITVLVVDNIIFRYFLLIVLTSILFVRYFRETWKLIGQLTGKRDLNKE